MIHSIMEEKPAIACRIAEAGFTPFRFAVPIK